MNTNIRKKWKIVRDFPGLQDPKNWQKNNPHNLEFQQHPGGCEIRNSDGLFEAILITDSPHHNWNDKSRPDLNIHIIESGVKGAYEDSLDIFYLHLVEKRPLILCRNERGKRVEQDIYRVSAIKDNFVYLKKI